MHRSYSKATPTGRDALWQGNETSLRRLLRPEQKEQIIVFIESPLPQTLLFLDIDGVSFELGCRRCASLCACGARIVRRRRCRRPRHRLACCTGGGPSAVYIPEYCPSHCCLLYLLLFACDVAAFVCFGSHDLWKLDMVLKGCEQRRQLLTLD